MNIWKKNILEDLEAREIEFAIAGKFLAVFKKKFGREDNKLAKIAEPKRAEYNPRTIEKFVYEFKRVVRSSGYEKRVLVEEFK